MTIIRKITIKAKKYLSNNDILLFVGARQVGKTTILKQLKQELEDKKQNTFFLNLEDQEYLSFLNESPKNIFKIFSFDLSKKSFLFIDEIQYLKNPSNFLKYLYDEYNEKIKLIVTGSSAFYIDRKFKDSLAGRKKIFYVSTLSFDEFLVFKNEERLTKLNFSNLSIDDNNKISKYYNEFMTYGSYPKVVLASVTEKKEILQEIAFSYIKKDIYESNIKNEESFYKLFKILASQTGGLVNSSSLANTLDISKTAIDNYLYVMQKSFHIALIKPFYENMQKELTKMPKIYFYDLGLRNFFVNNFDSFITRLDKGELLENAVFCQFREKFESDDLRFWRTKDKNEVDFVVDNKSAYEVKVNEKNFIFNKYNKFLKIYPNINLSLITIDKKSKKISDNIFVFNVWEI